MWWGFGGFEFDEIIDAWNREQEANLNSCNVSCLMTGVNGETLKDTLRIALD
jgi:hypothetical protein